MPFKALALTVQLTTSTELNASITIENVFR